MKSLFEKTAANEQEMTLVAKDIYEEFLKTEKPFVVFLHGGLGAGKTFLVREFLRLEGTLEDITSPTFTYVEEYDGVAHFDFYRFTEGDAFFAFGFDEIATDDSISCFVEWGDKLTDDGRACFGENAYTINIEKTKEGGRKVELLKNV